MRSWLANNFDRLQPVPLSGLRIGIPQGSLLSNLDETVAARFFTATAALRNTDARLTDEALGLLDGMAAAGRNGSFAQIEGYAIHREMLAKGARTTIRSFARVLSKGAISRPPTI